MSHKDTFFRLMQEQSDFDQVEVTEFRVYDRDGNITQQGFTVEVDDDGRPGRNTTFETLTEEEAWGELVKWMNGE